MTARWRLAEAGEDRWLVPVLMLFAFTLPITISISQAASFLLIPLWLWRRRAAGVAGPQWNAMGLCSALFVIAVLLASLMGVRPAHSLGKMANFGLLVVAFIIPVLDAPRPGALVRRLLAAFLAGSTVQALYDVIRIPWAAWTSAHAAPTPGAGAANVLHQVSWADLALFSQGNMRDPQFYLVAVLLLVALWAAGRQSLARPCVWVPLVLNALALLLHFKRGALFATMLGVALIALLAKRPRLLIALGAAALLLLAVPQFRERIAMTKNEFSVSLKGRYPLWTEAAPHLLKAHPFGLGWKALRYQDLRAATRHVQFGLNHLHNNLLQIAVEIGWLGAALWLAWMLAAAARFSCAWRVQRRAMGVGAGLALGLLCGFLGLMLTGMVEYNFGDAEIFMLLALLWGCGSALAGPTRADPA